MKKKTESELSAFNVIRHFRSCQSYHKPRISEFILTFPELIETIQEKHKCRPLGD